MLTPQSRLLGPYKDLLNNGRDAITRGTAATRVRASGEGAIFWFASKPNGNPLVPKLVVASVRIAHRRRHV